MDRVQKFMNLPIVATMMFFRDLPARFLADAVWHKEWYGISPMLGLFWNLCLNAWFPGQVVFIADHMLTRKIKLMCYPKPDLLRMDWYRTMWGLKGPVPWPYHYHGCFQGGVVASIHVRFGDFRGLQGPFCVLHLL
ncbi:hypothetical protein B0H14DRAFT_2584586 [Mycena olivaceomarginata]|nr:hypothetical protein B0H14DRAFT_2584586 [Mycena olivaceomarginata]